MTQTSSTGSYRPLFQYTDFLGPFEEATRLAAPDRVTLLLPGRPEREGGNGVLLKKGVKVKTGQKLKIAESDADYVISSVTGVVSSIATWPGDFGKVFTAITIDARGPEVFDDAFSAVSQEEPSLENATGFLAGVAGSPCFKAFSDPEKPIHTIVVLAEDADLVVNTREFLVVTENAAVAKGIKALKQITGVKKVILALPRDRVQNQGHMGAELRAVGDEYPAALPRMIMKDVLGQTVPAQKTSEDLGVAFFNVEAAASIGKACEDGRLPVEKTLTVVDKEGTSKMAVVRMGISVGALLGAFGIELKERDRIIIGGPLTGSAIFSEDHPIGPDTDCVMVQDGGDLPLTSDYPCTNCGECIGICPVLVPVNMLIRFLEAGQYEDAADEYDLHCCVECGLCAYVCPSRIPIFQYIRLAKYELGRSQ
ncbi:MAG: hypothetical protein GY859_09305 [Desulfobacterales bacterium]|nr:hypothetical protein [Desulfobacterales bacterium]